MSEKTTNYNLEKPLQSEFYDVEVQNRNMDKIDEELKNATDHIGQDAKHITEAERLSWNNKANSAVATPTTNGLMSAADKGKLNGIAVGANNYVHPNDTNARHVTDAEKTSWNSKANTAVATAAANGLMSAADKGKLDGVATCANKTVIANNLTTSVVGSALDAVQGKVLDGKITQVNTSLNESIKRDGSVQMTGALKTVGGVGTVKQIDFGAKVACYSDGASFTIATNAYYDNVSKNWLYVANGKAGIININPIDPNRPMQTYYAKEGVQDGIIAPWIENTPLTPKTGLPLTGGTLSGNLVLNGNHSRLFSIEDTTTQYMSQLHQADSALILRNKKTISDYSDLYMRPNTTPLTDAIQYHRSGVGVYKIYGEHNITVSQTAPTAALANGCMHNVY